MLLALLLILLLWMSWDLLVPSKSNFRAFDPKRIGQHETIMWKAYYEKKPVYLFIKLTETLRFQFKAPFWKSQLLAFYASKAAVTFQKGKNREDYNKALPYLRKYFSGINALSAKSFDVSTVASNELEWWIIRRESELHSPNDWEKLISQIAAEIYHIPEYKVKQHSALRVRAMLMRDQLGDQISSEDWKKIEKLLIECWESLHKAVNEK